MAKIDHAPNKLGANPLPIRATDTLSADEQKQQALVDKIYRSKIFKHPVVKEILQILADHYFLKGPEVPLSTRGLQKGLEERKVGAIDDETIRRFVMQLRAALGGFAKDHPDEDWKVDFPKDGPKGYFLAFESSTRNVAISAVEAFWAAHTEAPDETLVVCGSHLFLHNPRNQSATRFYGFNVRKNEAETLKDFARFNKRAYSPALKPWFHSYLSNGEVTAYERLQRWFLKSHKVNIERFQSREISDEAVFHSRPILLGRPDTNEHLELLMTTPNAAKLGYKIHNVLGAIHVAGKTTAKERKAFREFPFKGGVLGPMPSNQMVFGLVSRLHGPNGRPVTVISADSHAKAVSGITEALTNEASAKAILNETEWNWRERMPRTFELLFQITVLNPDLRGAGEMKLLASRKV